MSNKQIQQIFQYIQQNGNFLSSQKVLKQVNLHGEIVWELIVKICSKLKNKNIEIAFAQMFFMLSEPQKHQRSVRWLKQFMDIKDLAIKVDITYGIMDYFIPQKDKIINFLHKIVELLKGVNKVKQSLDELLVKDEVLTRQLNKHRLKQEATKIQLQEIKERKQAEKIIFDQILVSCNEINQQLSLKRQQKIDLLQKQKAQKEQISQLQKVLEDIRRQNQGRVAKIQNLEKEIAMNAPEVKKQMRAVEQELQSVSRQTYADIEAIKFKQSKLIETLKQRQSLKPQIIQCSQKIISQFSAMEQAKINYNKIEDEYETYRKRRLQLISQQQQVNNIIHQIEIQYSNDNSLFLAKQAEKRQRENQYRLAEFNSLKIKDQSRTIKQKFKKFKSINDKLKSDLQSIVMKFDQKYKQFENKRKYWEEFTQKSLVEIYQPIHSLDFDY